jgi:hypothetical protein
MYSTIIVVSFQSRVQGVIGFVGSGVPGEDSGLDLTVLGGEREPELTLFAA